MSKKWLIFPSRILTKITSTLNSTFHWSCLSQLLSKVQDLPVVSVLAKMLQVGDKHEAKPGLLYSIEAGRHSYWHIKLTLYQNDIDYLEEGNSTNWIVKSYNATKYLSPPKTGLCSTSLADLGEVMWEPDTCSLTVAISVAVVVGVNDLQSHKACIKINVAAPTDTVGICSKCSLLQKINRCPLELTACEAGILKILVHFIPLHHSRIQYISKMKRIIQFRTFYCCRNPAFTCSHAGCVITGVQRGGKPELMIATLGWNWMD